MNKTATEILGSGHESTSKRMPGKNALKFYKDQLELRVVALHSLWLQIPDDLTKEADQALWELINKIRN